MTPARRFSCYSDAMRKEAYAIQACQFLLAVTISVCGPHLSVQAQETSEQDVSAGNVIDEIVVVGRDGKSIDVDTLRLEEARLKVVREFQIERHKQEEELWRLKLRSVMQRKTSRFVWGYDAQDEAARFRYSQAHYLPIDRVAPATFVSIRF